jgi:DNA invertase Pin-like site-specific DNA recombinase
MKIGYAMVVTKDQHINLQIDALKDAGCEKIYEEIAGGANVERKVLSKLITILQEHDVLVVWKLDRLGGSLKNLIAIVNQLLGKKINISSLHGHIDITPVQGGLFAMLAEFERNTTREKTQSGLLSIRARGRAGGKPPGLSEEAKIAAQSAETLYLEQKLSVRQIAEQLGICKATLYAYLKHRKVKIGSYISKSKKIVEQVDQDKQHKVSQENYTKVPWDPMID